MLKCVLFARLQGFVECEKTVLGGRPEIVVEHCFDIFFGKTVQAALESQLLPGLLVWAYILQKLVGPLTTSSQFSKIFLQMPGVRIDSNTCSWG